MLKAGIYTEPQEKQLKFRSVSYLIVKFEVSYHESVKVETPTFVLKKTISERCQEQYSLLEAKLAAMALSEAQKLSVVMVELLQFPSVLAYNSQGFEVRF